MAEFGTANVSTLKVKVNTDANGNIAQAGNTVAGNKVLTIPGFKQAGNLANANTFFGAIIGTLGGGSYDSLTAQKYTVQEVVE